MPVNWQFTHYFLHIDVAIFADKAECIGASLIIPLVTPTSPDIHAILVSTTVVWLSGVKEV